MTEGIEVWKDVPVAEARGLYEVSNLGRVRRVNSTHVQGGGFILKGALDSAGYRVVCLSVNGWTKSFKIHTLVATAFCAKGQSWFSHCNHKDANKQNNRWNNLEWTTHSKNLSHAAAMGRMSSGEHRWCSKLTWEDVDWIREKGIGLSATKLKEIFGVCHSTIHKLRRGEIWVRRPWISAATSANELNTSETEY